MRRVLGDKLIGAYLGGSLVIGDFDPRVSDIDLIAIVADDVDDREFAALAAMHAAVAGRFPEWAGRIEVRYAARATVNGEGDGPIVSISPGEPINRRASGVAWLMDWYLVRERSVALVGPPPAEIVRPIPSEDFVRSIVAHVRSWDGWIDAMQHRKGQAYAILSMCRALYTCTHGGQLSKVQAAAWAQAELPEWADLIANALLWRVAPDDPTTDNAATFDRARRFVLAVRERILAP